MKMWLPTIWAVFAGVFVGLAFLFPETNQSLVLGWIAAFVIAQAHCAHAGWRSWTAFGVTLGLIGFYWLTNTLQLFGGFPASVAFGLFFLFTLTIGVQFALTAVVSSWLERITLLTASSLALPLAWFSVEFLFPRLFPWTLAHTQIVWASFSSLAELVRVEFLTAVMLWVALVIMKLARRDRAQSPYAVFIAGALCAVSLWQGTALSRRAERAIVDAPTLRVGLIQGNLDLFEKRRIASLADNLEKHRALSRLAIANGAQLLVWPESVLAAWAPISLTSFRGNKLDPFPDATVPLLFGGLSYSPRDVAEYRALLDGAWGTISPDYAEDLRVKRFNTAFGIDKNGQVLGYYHKKVLMPFGEFLPFARRFPLIQQISPMSGDFDFGQLEEPITFSFETPASDKAASRAVKVMPLVCYEDLIPQLSRAAVQRGADLLVNLTNDAWYGKTVAPFEHHLLAQWRAIETRRSLLRVTNTGLTAVVNPLGRTEVGLPIFQSGQLVRDVPLLSLTTPYVRYGDLPFSVAAWSILVLAIIVRRRFTNLK